MEIGKLLAHIRNGWPNRQIILNLIYTLRALAGDTIPPVLNFEPATLQVASGGTADSVFSATDNFGIRTGPNITCTEGGSFAGCGPCYKMNVSQSAYDASL